MTPSPPDAGSPPIADGDRPALAHALSDGEDCLVSADEPLATLQTRCGGDLPGRIAVASLLEVVRKARRYGLRLVRPIAAQDGTDAIGAWVEVQPRGDGKEGCEILLRSWRKTPLPPADARQSADLRAAIERQVAELTATLDAGQRLLAVLGDAPDLQTVVEAMRGGIGRPWTDFVQVKGSDHAQPLHWRLLDGAEVAVPGSDRTWRAHLIAHQAPGFPPAGFELLLSASEPLAIDAPAVLAETMPAMPQPVRGHAIIGQEIGPVLRQPIARIIANAETIRTRLAGPLADEYAQYASQIATSAQHLLHLLDDLADLEVLDADGFSTAPDRIDLADVVRQAAGILGVRARESGVSIATPAMGESLEAVAEFRRVLQILLNLIGNAVRYSPAGTQVRIGLEESGDRARVIVADEGPGLSEEQAGIVFEKFERLGRSGDGGSGLGLYISRRLARAMGGELSVKSEPGHGARFILELPAPAED